MNALLLGVAAIAFLAATLLLRAATRAAGSGAIALAVATYTAGAAFGLWAFVLDNEPRAPLPSAWIGLCAASFALASLVGAVQLARTIRALGHSSNKLAALEEEQHIYVDEASTHLEVSRDRFRALTDAASLGVLEFDATGACFYASRRWSELTGLDRAQALGDGWLEVLQPDRASELIAAWRSAVERGERFDRELCLTRETGAGSRWGMLSIAPKLARAGARPGFIGTLRDITERHHVELEREQLEERVRRAETLESLGVLAGGIAHDFNNLVIGILGNLEALQGRLWAGEKVDVQIARVEGAALSAAALASQLLAYAGRGSSAREWIDLSSLVDEIAPLIDFARPEDVELALELDRELPPFSGEATQLRQVIMNLLTNAFQACDEGGRCVRVRTTARPFRGDELQRNVLGTDLPPGEYLMLEVEDDGRGFDPQTSESLFDPFFTTRAEGRGLGLAVVLGVMRRSRGSIQIESVPGKGTRVRVLFPPGDREGLPLASS